VQLLFTVLRLRPERVLQLRLPPPPPSFPKRNESPRRPGAIEVAGRFAWTLYPQLRLDARHRSMRAGLEIRALGKIRPMSERNVLIRVRVLSRLLSEALTELDANALSSAQLLDQLREVGDSAAEQLDQLAPCGRE
jgi:hypothetical protein